MQSLPPRSSAPVALLVAALVTGCIIPMPVGGSGDEEGDASTSADSGGSEAPPVDTSTSIGGTGLVTTGEPEPTSSTSSEDGTETGVVFIMMGDGGIFDPCDPWTQNCGRGEKCTPAAMGPDGDQWDWARCSPVVPEPDAVGEPCSVEGSGLSGIDTCGFGAMCWDVDPETLQGTCVALCTGSEDFPTCAPEGTVCSISNDGFLPLCLPACNPVLQDCPGGQSCFPVGDVFVCAPDDPAGNPGGPGEPCSDIAMCDAGSICVLPELVPDCVDPGGCCTPFCALSDPMPPCLPGQVCTPWFEDGMAPEGLEDVGACMLPT